MSILYRNAKKLIGILNKGNKYLQFNFFFHFVFILSTGGLGTRHWVTFMLFLGMANAYIMRTNMSVAIVAMVNHTALTVIAEEIDTECGPVNPNKTSVSI